MQSHAAARRLLITTPIFYVNANPHIGHIYSVLLADAQARFQRLKNHGEIMPLLSTGTDEHGLKIQQAAAKSGSKTLEFCDKVSANFKGTFDKFNVEYHDFIRTTEERHSKAVQHCWRQLQAKGWLTKKSYESWYCVQDESFLTDHQIDKEKRISLESGHPVEWAQEENYTFPLGEFKDKLNSWLSKNVIKPKVFKSHLDYFLRSDAEMPDLSVSRSSKRLTWGIPVPGDPSQTIYVWLDALVNYLTVSGYPDQANNWPPFCHVIGKDILKFHAIYWPAFLMALELELPRQIFCHSHWTVGDTKMSKSKGNVIDPNALAEKYTNEGLRYFLLREGVPHSDGNYSEEQLINYLNNDLANTLGNLLGRVTAPSVNVNMTFSNDTFEYDSKEAEQVLICLRDLKSRVEVHFEEFNFYLGINDIMECLRTVNAYVQAEKPWELKKAGELERLSKVLNLSLESLRICAILLQPIVPSLCDKVLTKLQIHQRSFSDAQMFNAHYINHELSQEKVMLFKKV